MIRNEVSDYGLLSNPRISPSAIILAGFCFRFLICFLFFISLTFDARAHDPGLSSARVTIASQQIDVLLGFAQRDVESILADDTNWVESDTAKGFAAVRSELESVITNEFSLYWGNQRVKPNQ